MILLCSPDDTLALTRKNLPHAPLRQLAQRLYQVIGLPLNVKMQQ
jgi:hypothetical protein